MGELFCNSCGHQPPAHVSCPKVDGSGQRKPAKAGKAEGRSSSDKGAEKLRAALADKQAAELKGKETAKALAAVTAELKQFKAPASVGAARSAATDSVPMEQESEDASANELAAAITQARDELKQLQDCNEFYRSLIPDFDGKVAAAQAKLEAAAAARRAANPLKKQLEGAQLYQTRVAKKLSDAKGSLEKHRLQLAEAQAALEKQEAAVAEAQATAAKADAEVAALATRFATQSGAAPAHPIAPPSASSVEQVQPGEGLVSIAFAEEKWAEREAAFAQQIAQLQALVVPALDVQSETSPSEAGDDLDLPDPLDDGAWSKVERAKRGKLLRKERDTLARNVRSKLSKVSAAASPFNK